jgi:hypothetical protein
MKHPNEEELIAYHDGDVFQRAALAGHVADCAECRAELDRIDAVLAALNTMTVPEPGEDYGRQVWQQIAPRLREKKAHWWDVFLVTPKAAHWLEPRRWVAVAAVAGLVIAAFLMGRFTKHGGPEPVATDAARQVRERVLIMAVGEHLGRSEMVLVELANAEPKNASARQVNISSEQRRAEDLLEENRLYRQTALEEGDTALANVLDELERVLLDVAHGPQEVTPAQLVAIRQRIEARGILFKVRVVSSELQRRGESTNPAPSPSGSQKKEGNKI